jgi:hypothetical protein
MSMCDCQGGEAMTDTLTPIQRITRDIRDASKLIDAHEARFLVDSYYQMQDDRIRSGHQLRTLAKSGEPNSTIVWLQEQTESLEGSMQRALDAYSTSRIDGRWLRSITGIGPVIAAGLMANIDIHKAPTAGHIWRFAGLDPTMKWEKGSKRPFNASLKRLAWIVGESFTKVAGLQSDVYGKIYVARKKTEIARNDAGIFAEQAATALATKDWTKRDTDAKRWYLGQYRAGTCATIAGIQDMAEREKYLKSVRLEPGEGVAMLPPGRIHLRAQRYAVKLLLSHYQHVLFESTFGSPPPKPYILSRGDHAHFMGPPNWPMKKAS